MKIRVRFTCLRFALIKGLLICTNHSGRPSWEWPTSEEAGKCSLKIATTQTRLTKRTDTHQHTLAWHGTSTLHVRICINTFWWEVRTNCLFNETKGNSSKMDLPQKRISLFLSLSLSLSIYIYIYVNMINKKIYNISNYTYDTVYVYLRYVWLIRPHSSTNLDLFVG